MPMAARVADPTTHGAPLAPGPGSTNVMIGGQPAWRAMIDQHACPAVSISGADGVGSVMLGSPTVMINAQMACRQLDIVIEKPGLAMGPANPILMGCPTVVIGEAGMGGPQSVQYLIDQAKVLEAAGKLPEAAAKKLEAINEAITVYGIHTANAKSITYDKTVSGEAVTASDGSVRIGDEAFRNAAWLGSSVGHEVETHVDQQAALGKWYTGPEGTAVQECQAYDYELANAGRYGTSAADQADLQKRRDDYRSQLSPEYQSRVDGHPPNYDMKPGEENQ